MSGPSSYCLLSRGVSVNLYICLFIYALNIVVPVQNILDKVRLELFITIEKCCKRCLLSCWLSVSLACVWEWLVFPWQPPAAVSGMPGDHPTYSAGSVTPAGSIGRSLGAWSCRHASARRKVSVDQPFIILATLWQHLAYLTHHIHNSQFVAHAQ